MASHPLLPAQKKPRVSREAAGKAVDAVLKWLRSKSSARDDLYLVLTLKKIPHGGRPFSFPIPVPHPIARPIFLIVDDRPSSPLSPSAALDLVRSLSLPISDVLHLSDLLLSPFDPRQGLFFADHRILPLLSRKISSKMKTKKKGKDKETPVVPINLTRPSWPDELRKCVGSTTLNFRGGTCCGIKVGQASSLSRDEIVENVMAAVEGAVAHVPKRWANVKSFHVKAAESLALPIYQPGGELVEGSEGEGGNEGLAELEEDREGEDGRSRRRKIEKLEGGERKERKRSKTR